MVTNVNVKTDELNTLARLLSEDVANMEQQMKKLDESISALNQTWKGSQKEKFEAEYDRLTEDLPGLFESLLNYKKTIERSGKRYETCENEVKSLVERM